MAIVEMKIPVMKCIDKKVQKGSHVLKLLPVSRSRTTNPGRSKHEVLCLWFQLIGIYHTSQADSIRLLERLLRLRTTSDLGLGGFLTILS